ncbi:MAG TPA: hypothetical protein VER12_03255 [Polyangiaceae bacterium]|nr:hypothetical protein [Polyangiaceae bacterium]HYQ26969.1 hypothetical protein [Polyangiaceae bacterium]
MSPRFTSVLISVFAGSTFLLTSAADAAPKKSKADVAKEQAEQEQAQKEQAAKEQADKEQAAKEQAEKEEAEKADAAKEEADKDAAAKEKAAKDAALVDDAEAGGSPGEVPGKTYYGVGLRYRGIIVPKFMMNLFGSGGTTILANGIGPEFVIRKDSFEYEFSAMFTGYGMDPTPFKAKSDGPDAWEIVESKIKVLYLTADFNWSHNFKPEFALNYGFGAGVGFVWGDLYRTQAYPGAGANPDTGEGFLKCTGPGNPNPAFCGSDNNHYNGYTEPNWANGGSKPIIFPWLAVQTGLRWKPHRNFIGRLDLGFSTSGPFFGLGADYGL